MGSAKFQIGGILFPISKRTNFSFEVMPTASGGTLVRHDTKAVVDVLYGPGSRVAKKIRINVHRVLGRDKKIILHQDMVRIGDQIFLRSGHGKDERRPPPRAKVLKSARPKRPHKK
jgi:hypothetical protein